MQNTKSVAVAAAILAATVVAAQHSSAPGSVLSSAPEQQPAPAVAVAAQTPSLAIPAGVIADVAATGVPDRCIVAGSAMFSACAREIGAPQARLNLTTELLTPANYTALLQARGVTRGQAEAALREVLAAPAPGCCGAACKFDAELLCDCEPRVLDVASRFAGADADFYNQLVQQLAAACGHPATFGAACPANVTEALLSKGPDGVLLAEGSAAIADILAGRCVPAVLGGAAATAAMAPGVPSAASP